MTDMTAHDRVRRRSPRPKSWWIPWLFVAGFGIVLVANGTMLVIALDSFTGIETEQAYQKGLAYNEEIAAARRQAALGWTVALKAGPLDGREIRVALDVRDSAARPLDGARVVAHFVRPTQADHDTEIVLPRTAPGHYEAVVGLPLDGVWDLNVELKDDRGAYRLHERLFLR